MHGARKALNPDKKKSSRSRAKEARRARSRSKKPQQNSRQSTPKGGARAVAYDFVRGMAIVLMVVDHFCWLFVDASIEPFSLRFFTRLAMPLFCVLSGYLAVSRKPTLGWLGMRWWRLGQMFLAAVVLNLVYAPSYGNGMVEILASLCVVHLLVSWLGVWSGLLAFGFLFYPWDISIPYFDYPLTVVATCVSAGVLMRIRWLYGFVFSIFTVGVLWSRWWYIGRNDLVTEPVIYVLWYLPAAILLIGWAGNMTERANSYGDLPPRTWERFFWPVIVIGRYPLTCYLAQYALLLGAHQLLSK